MAISQFYIYEYISGDKSERRELLIHNSAEIKCL